MRGPTWRILIGLAVLLVVAACGGGAGPASGGASEAPGVTEPAGGAPSAEASSDAGAPSVEASTAASPAGGGGGGGGTASDACGLATPEEIGAVFGVTGVTSQLIDGFPPTCDIQLDSAPFMAIVLVDDAASAGPIYDAWAADPAATPISGVGDRAVFAPSNVLLVVQRGDRVASLALFDDGTTTEDERIALLTEVAKVAAGRL